MRIDDIVSTRNQVSGCCFDVIYRWEDVLSRLGDFNIVSDERLSAHWLKFFGENRVLRWMSLVLPWIANLLSTNKNCLVFELDSWRRPGFNKKNIIPCVIDFWERSWIHLVCFWLSYRKCPVVLISSKEAYDFLRSVKMRLPISHWALSIPDELVSVDRLTNEKKYDMACFGRANPMLFEFVERYAEEHPDFSFLKKARIDGRWAYETLKGDFVAFADTYEDYLKMMEQVRIGIYCTPGMDDSRHETHGFSQVTPRFLEYLSAGCHVIARYSANSDVEYYELPSMCPNITDYGQFCREVDRMRREPVDVKKYMTYLSRHKTSVRAAELQAILKNIS